MNKCLVISFSLVFISMNAYAGISIDTYGSKQVAHINNVNNINLSEIKEISADEFVISNSSVVINNFSDWQDWNTTVSLDPIVTLYINNLDNSVSGEKVKHLTLTNKSNVTIQDTNNLYRTSLDKAEDNSVFLKLVRETNYEKVFKNDSRGKFLENIRANNQNDKMLAVMDRASTMHEINSIMNSSYHFNPMVLMNPVKTINRSMLLSMQDFNSGADVDFILSSKLNNYGGHVYLSDKYDDLSVKIGINLNSFSYSDNTNEFDGFSYGIDLRAKQYFEKIWIDGLLGLNRINFNADNIYVNGNISSNPNGMSGYARFNLGYDYTKISEIIISPFVGFIFQRSSVMDFADADINLHTGIIAKYDFITDGIKYEYGANLSMDEKAYCNFGVNAGFVSVMDNAGAFIMINTFKDEFATNYKFSLNAKILF